MLSLFSLPFPCNTDFEPPAHLVVAADPSPPIVRRIDVGTLAKKAHLRQDDCITALQLIGFLPSHDPPEQGKAARLRGTERWDGVQVTAHLDVLLKACEHFRVRAVGVLDPEGCLI
jgi:hypothetical protein